MRPELKLKGISLPKSYVITPCGEHSKS